jgi:hypothetical protein
MLLVKIFDWKFRSPSYPLILSSSSTGLKAPVWILIGAVAGCFTLGVVILAFLLLRLRNERRRERELEALRPTSYVVSITQVDGVRTKDKIPKLTQAPQPTPYEPSRATHTVLEGGSSAQYGLRSEGAECRENDAAVVDMSPHLALEGFYSRIAELVEALAARVDAMDIDRPPSYSY